MIILKRPILVLLENSFRFIFIYDFYCPFMIYRDIAFIPSFSHPLEDI